MGKQDSRPGVEPPCWHTGEIALPSGIREWIIGVNAFAKGMVDPGTGFLLAHLPEKNPFPDQPGKLLDFGCGSGVITAELIQRGWNIEPFMLDADAISLSVASKNIPNSTAWIGDGWIGVPNQQRFDTIVSNPPFHQGVLRDLGVVNRLIAKAPKHLTPKGRMWMVTQRQVHVGDNLGKAFKRVDIVKQNSQYRIWRAEGI